MSKLISYREKYLVLSDMCKQLNLLTCKTIQEYDGILERNISRKQMCPDQQQYRCLDLAQQGISMFLRSNSCNHNSLAIDHYVISLCYYGGSRCT